MNRDDPPSRRAILAGALAVPTVALLTAAPAAASPASGADWAAALAAYEGELGWDERERAPPAPDCCLEDQRSFEQRWEPYRAARRAHEARLHEALRRLMLTPAPDFEALVVKQSIAFRDFCCREDGEVRRALAADLSRLSRGG